MSHTVHHSVWRVAGAVLFAFAADTVWGARVFVGIMEADSYQSVIYGASAFSRVSDLPLVLEVVNDTLMRRMAVPSFDGVSATDTLRYVLTADPSRPLGDDNPSGVALIPLADQGTSSQAAFTAAYAKRSTDTPPFVVFEAPHDTNLSARVATALSGHYLFTSTSTDALAWAWENREKLMDAPSQSISGTVRMLVNPQRFADILGTRGQKAYAFINLDKFLRDFDTLSFSLNVDGQSLTLTLRGKPLANTPLQALSAALHEPTPTLWNGVPNNAFFSSVSACGNLKPWDAYLNETPFNPLDPMRGLAPDEAFADERLIYLAPPRAKAGLCLVQILPVKNSDAAGQAIQKLQNAKIDERISLVRRPPSQTPKTFPIETYDVQVRAPAPAVGGATKKGEEASLAFTIASLFLRHAVLEATVTNGYLVAALGPASGTLEGELSALAFAQKPVSLPRQLVLKNPMLDGTVTSATFLNAADLLRHIASIMPGIKPEQLRVLSASGGGASFGLCKGSDQTLTASLSIQSNEITALQRINRDGREVLQELFFQMFTHQMMNLDKKAEEPPQFQSAP